MTTAQPPAIAEALDTRVRYEVAALFLSFASKVAGES